MQLNNRILHRVYNHSPNTSRIQMVVDVAEVDKPLFRLKPGTCVCVCVCALSPVCVRTYVHAYVYVYMCQHGEPVRLYVCVCVCDCARAVLRAGTECQYVMGKVCDYVCVYVCVCMCVCVHSICVLMAHCACLCTVLYARLPREQALS